MNCHILDPNVIFLDHDCHIFLKMGWQPWSISWPAAGRDVRFGRWRPIWPNRKAFGREILSLAETSNLAESGRIRQDKSYIFILFLDIYNTNMYDQTMEIGFWVADDTSKKVFECNENQYCNALIMACVVVGGRSATDGSASESESGFRLWSQLS